MDAAETGSELSFDDWLATEMPVAYGAIFDTATAGLPLSEEQQRGGRRVFDLAAEGRLDPASADQMLGVVWADAFPDSDSPTEHLLSLAARSEVTDEERGVRDNLLAIWVTFRIVHRLHSQEPDRFDSALYADSVLQEFRDLLVERQASEAWLHDLWNPASTFPHLLQTGLPYLDDEQAEQVRAVLRSPAAMATAFLRLRPQYPDYAGETDYLAAEQFVELLRLGPAYVDHWRSAIEVRPWAVPDDVRELLHGAVDRELGRAAVRGNAGGETPVDLAHLLVFCRSLLDDPPLSPDLGALDSLSPAEERVMRLLANSETGVGWGELSPADGVAAYALALRGLVACHGLEDRRLLPSWALQEGADEVWFRLVRLPSSFHLSEDVRDAVRAWPAKSEERRAPYASVWRAASADWPLAASDSSARNAVEEIRGVLYGLAESAWRASWRDDSREYAEQMERLGLMLGGVAWDPRERPHIGDAEAEFWVERSVANPFYEPDRATWESLGERCRSILTDLYSRTSREYRDPTDILASVILQRRSYVYGGVDGYRGRRGDGTYVWFVGRIRLNPDVRPWVAHMARADADVANAATRGWWPEHAASLTSEPMSVERLVAGATPAWEVTRGGSDGVAPSQR